MDCYFISERSLECTHLKKRNQINFKGRPWLVVARAYVELNPVSAICSSEAEGKKAVLQMLESRMAPQIADTGGKRMNLDEERFVRVLIGSMYGGDIITVTVISTVTGEKNNHFHRLEQVLGKSNITFNCEIRFGAEDCVSDGTKKDITLTEFPAHEIYNNESAKGFTLPLPYTPAQMQRWVENPEELKVSICLLLKMNDKAVNFILMTDPASNYGHLMNSLCTGCMDATVVAQGKEMRVHRAYLTAVSTVMEAMFEHAMVQTSSNTIYLDDMTQHAVDALFEYLYGLDTTEILKSCEVAYELLRAGHNYRIPRLREVAGLIILVKESTWFNPTVIANLLAFAKSNLGGDEDEFYRWIKDKALALAKM